MCPKQRREVLAALGVGVGLGLAGCASDDNGGGNGDSSEDNSDNGNEGDDGENETITPLCADTGVVVEGPDDETHCVAAVESDQSIEEYYGYDTETQNSSALADEIEVADATISFVYRNTTTGDRSLVVVHDSPDGGTGGDVVMTFQGIDGTDWVVKDDPEPRSSSEAYETPQEAAGDSISAVWGWSGDSSLTDGGAIGPLGESFDITITHHQEGTAKETTASRKGIDRWLFVDGADPTDPIELAEFTDDNAGDSSIRLSTSDSAESSTNGDDANGNQEDGSNEDGDSTDSGDDGSVSYTLEIQNGNVSAFDSLVVTFESFELRAESRTVSREGTGEEIDLTAIDTKTILETTVPPGEYDHEALFLPVSEYQASDGSEGEFLDNDPMLMGDGFVLEEGESVTARAQISVQGQGDDWGFTGGTLRY